MLRIGTRRFSTRIEGGKLGLFGRDVGREQRVVSARWDAA